MGRGAPCRDNRGTPVTDELLTLAAVIRVLIAAPDAPLHLLEDTLTTGYARALELEAERGRLERRIGELVAKGEAGELAELAKRVAATDDDLVSLRDLLTVLRDRASAARV